MAVVASCMCTCLVLNKIVDNCRDVPMWMAITTRTKWAVCHRSGGGPRAESCMPLLLAEADIMHEIPNLCSSVHNMQLKVGFQEHRTRVLLKHLVQAHAYAQNESPSVNGAMKCGCELWLRVFRIVVTRFDWIVAGFQADALLLLARRVRFDSRKDVIGRNIAY